MRCAPLSPMRSRSWPRALQHFFSKTFGLETVSLRYFNVFGPRQQPESQYAAVIPKFMQCAKMGKPLEVHSDASNRVISPTVENVCKRISSPPQDPKWLENIST